MQKKFMPFLVSLAVSLTIEHGLWRKEGADEDTQVRLRWTDGRLSLRRLMQDLQQSF